MKWILAFLDEIAYTVTEVKFYKTKGGFRNEQSGSPEKGNSAPVP